jgi:hypothetical protein
MFKGIAELGAVRRHVVRQAAPSHCNDNRPDRRPATVLQGTRPQGLTCHWGLAAAGGRLECHWQIEPADGAPEPSSKIEHIPELLGIALRGQPAIRIAAL